MNLLATITNGYALKNAESMTKEERETLMDRIESNDFTENEFQEAGFKAVHFEGIAWEDGEHIAGFVIEARAFKGEFDVVGFFMGVISADELVFSGRIFFTSS